MKKFGHKVEHHIHNALASVGDHLGAQHPDPDKKIVPGAGTVPARAVTTRHSNKKSVGTENCEDETLAQVSSKGAMPIQQGE